MLFAHLSSCHYCITYNLWIIKQDNLMCNIIIKTVIRPRKTDEILDFLFLHKPFALIFMSIVTKFNDLFSNGFLAEQVLLHPNKWSSLPFNPSNQNGHIKNSNLNFSEVWEIVWSKEAKILVSYPFQMHLKWQGMTCMLDGNKTISTYRIVLVAIWIWEKRMRG